MCTQCDDYKAFEFDDGLPKQPIISDDLTAAVLLLLWDDNTRSMMNIIRREWDSKITFKQNASRELVGLLARNHAQAAQLGRQRAGSESPFDSADMDFGYSVALEQARYLDGLVADVQNGRYGEFEKGFDSPEVQEENKKLEKRLEAYSGGLIASGNAAWALMTMGAGKEIWWMLGYPERHCIDCPRIAAGNPYSAKNPLTQFPKDGNTRCLWHCYCYLRDAEGNIGFMPNIPKERQVS